MTIEEARKLWSAWEDMNSETYQAFKELTSAEREYLLRSLADASKVAGNEQKHWTEKAFVWERWQELRSRYSSTTEQI